MYCVKCGVELADSEKKCPLCQTPVYFPGLPEDVKKPYPDNDPPIARMNKKVIYLVLSFLFLIAALVSLITDYNISGAIDWSGYVVGGILVAYIIVFLPAWFPRKARTPAIFAPVDFVAIGLYLAYISDATGGGWFVSFALPITAGVALIIISVLVLCYYLRRGYLYIFGGAFIAFGGFSVLIEWLIHANFEIAAHIPWSVYPAVSLFLIGMMLIIIAIVKPFRESLNRIFSLYPPK